MVLYVWKQKKKKSKTQEKCRFKIICFDNIYLYFYLRVTFSSGQMNVWEKLAQQFAEYMIQNCTIFSENELHSEY